MWGPPRSGAKGDSACRKPREQRRPCASQHQTQMVRAASAADQAEKRGAASDFQRRRHHRGLIVEKRSEGSEGRANRQAGARAQRVIRRCLSPGSAFQRFVGDVKAENLFFLAQSQSDHGHSAIPFIPQGHRQSGGNSRRFHPLAEQEFAKCGLKSISRTEGSPTQCKRTARRWTRAKRCGS